MNDVAIPAGGHQRSRSVFVLAMTCVSAVAVAAVYWLFQPGPEELFDQGLALAQDDPVASERLLERAIRSRGGSYPDAEVAICRLLVKRKAWKEVAARFAAIDVTACASDQLLDFGRLALSVRARPQAISALEAVSQRDAAHATMALELLMASHREWGERQKLITAATRLTCVQPDSARNWILLIECLTAFGSESECAAAARDALQHDLPTPVRCSIRYSLVQQLINLGQAAIARAELEGLRREEGESVRVRGLEVYLLRLEGRLESALELATQICSEAPDLTFARFTHGIICVDLGQFKDAITDLEATTSTQPFNAPAHFKLSEAYRGLNRHDEAAKHRRIASEIVEKQKRVSLLLEKRELNPQDPGLYAELEQLHRELGQVEAAEMWHRWLNRLALTGESVDLPR